MYNKSLTYIFYINLSKWMRNKWFGDRHYCFLLNIFFYQGLTLLKPVVQSMSLSPSHKAWESRMLSCPWVSCYKHNNNRLKSWFGFKIFFCTCIFKAVEFILSFFLNLDTFVCKNMDRKFKKMGPWGIKLETLASYNLVCWHYITSGPERVESKAQRQRYRYCVALFWYFILKVI